MAWAFPKRPRTTFDHTRPHLTTPAFAFSFGRSFPFIGPSDRARSFHFTSPLHPFLHHFSTLLPFIDSFVKKLIRHHFSSFLDFFFVDQLFFRVYGTSKQVNKDASVQSKRSTLFWRFAFFVFPSLFFWLAQNDTRFGRTDLLTAMLGRLIKKNKKWRWKVSWAIYHFGHNRKKNVGGIQSWNNKKKKKHNKNGNKKCWITQS